MLLITCRRARVAPAAALSVAVVLAGCRSYEPRPLDVSGASRAWTMRSADDESLAAFARRLGESEGAGGAFDPADGVSLAEAEAVALFFNPDLRVGRLRAGVAEAAAAHAGLWEDPVLGFDAERILRNVAEPWLLGATLGITFPVSGRLDAEKSLAGAEHSVALREVLAQEWSTRCGLRREWARWSALVTGAEELRRLLAALDEIVGTAGRLEEAGEMARPEARLFRLERVTRASDLRRLEAEARVAEIRLRAMMGLAPDAPVRLLPSLARGPADVGGTGETDAEALAVRNPTLALHRAAYAAAEESLRLEVRKQYPDVTIGPGVGVEDGDPRVLLGVTLPVPLWNRNQRGIAAAEAEREVARAVFEGELQAVVSSLAAARVSLAVASEQREEVERVLIPMVDEQYADVGRIARAGSFDALLALDAITRQHETRVRLIEARLGEALAAVDVEELKGTGGAGVRADDRPADGAKEVMP